ncbi:MAG TPA: helix-hairpin-helix domain-containing protein [Bryobacteraceae bacterium]|nr:helix-hairpin-helix domain-containing protein [Bryobacteraceae bacterium]
MIRTLILLTAIAAVPMWAQDELPEGPGKATTIRICTACHGAEMWSTSHKSADDWDRTITTMTEKGLSISDADYGVVLDYLSKNLGTQPAKLNVNKATSDQLAKTLGIDPKQADAIIAYRTKNGDFKDLDGLKKVEGLDAAKVDAKKDAIAF